MKSKIFTLFALLLWLQACNTATDDVRPIVEVVLETGPETPFIINPDKLINGEVSDLQFTNLPARGVTDNLVDGKFLRYTPNTSFEDGEDHFDLMVKDSDGNDLSIEITVKVTDDPCDYAPAFDYIELQTGETITKDLLANDFFCGQIPTFTEPGSPSGALSFHLVESDFSNGLGNSFEATLDLLNNQVDAHITGPETPGVIKIIYEVGFDIKSEYMVGFPSNSRFLKEGGGLIPKAFNHYMVSEATIVIKD